MAKTEAAVYTKIRTRFGKRLSFDDYIKLANLSLVREIAEHLKNTKFSDSLKDYTYVELHRGKLENVLYTHSLFDGYSACMYDKAIGDSLSFLILQKEEIDELISFLCCLKAGEPSNYILNLSLAKNKLAELDLSALSRVSSIGELKTFLRGTRYYKYISSLLTDDFSVREIDLALKKAFYRSAERRIRASGAAEGALKILFLKAEIEDINLYFRALNFFPNSLKKIRPYLINRPALLKKSESVKLFSCTDIDSFNQILLDSKYSGEIQSSGELSVRLFIKALIKNIHFSSDPFLVLLSYIFYLEEEYNDLKTIIESVRYKVLPDEIIKNLNIINAERRE